MRTADFVVAIEPPSRWRWEWRLEPSRLLGGPANSQPQPVIGPEFHDFFATVFRHTHDEAGGNLPRRRGTARLPPGQDVLLDYRITGGAKIFGGWRAGNGAEVVDFVE